MRGVNDTNPSHNSHSMLIADPSEGDFRRGGYPNPLSPQSAPLGDAAGMWGKDHAESSMYSIRPQVLQKITWWVLSWTNIWAVIPTKQLLQTESVTAAIALAP